MPGLNRASNQPLAISGYNYILFTSGWTVFKLAEVLTLKFINRLVQFSSQLRQAFTGIRHFSHGGGLLFGSCGDLLGAGSIFFGDRR